MNYKIGDRVEPNENDDIPAELRTWLTDNHAHVERMIDDEFRPYFKILSDDEPYYKAEKIARLKQMLSDTDYKTMKYAEGQLTEEEYASVKTQRQAWRDEINQLEEELSSTDDIQE